MSEKDGPTRMVKGGRGKRNTAGGNENLFADISSNSFRHEHMEMEGNTTNRIDDIESVIPTKPKDTVTIGGTEKLTPDDGDMTRLASPRHVKKDEKEIKSYIDDPVAGWVVVIQGAGQGISLPIGIGMNSIGRGEDQRIKMLFGDEQISRDTHATISYDPKGRIFYLQHGGGKNLTYLDDGNSLSPVLSPVQLKRGNKIQLGDTLLSFVPFCGEDFEWSEVVSNDS